MVTFFPRVRYYEPNGNVISRTGDRCIVALTEQWFIDYTNKELKENVCQYVENEMKNMNTSLQNSLSKSVRELHEWPCSRSFGLGTILLGTNELIDSLSDSTIYMAYYTIGHIINNIPIEYVNQEMFDYVFLNKEYNFPKDYEEQIKEMRKEFMFWYPMDIRISGKDLISNHLSMSLYNHFAIWKDKNYMPRSYIANGYLMIKPENAPKPVKMSKSNGTFITMRDAMRKYGINAVRYTLAYNYRFDNGVFDVEFAKSMQNKFGEKDWLNSHFYNIIGMAKRDENEIMNIWDNLFNEDIDYILSKIDDYYQNTKYKEIIDLFDKLINSKNEYVKMQKILHYELIDKYINCALILLYPIVPNLAEDIIDNTACVQIKFPEFNNKNITREYGYYRDIINDVCMQARKITKKIDGIKNITINVFKDFTKIENDIIKDPSLILNNKGEIFGIYKAFDKYIQSRKEKYGEYVFNSKEEFNILKNNINILLGSEFIVQINYIDSSNESMFKYGPGKPRVMITK